MRAQDDGTVARQDVLMVRAQLYGGSEEEDRVPREFFGKRTMERGVRGNLIYMEN